MFSFHVINLGCRVNSIESEQVIDSLSSYGWKNVALADAQVAVINTCTVTHKADKKSQQSIRKAARSPYLKWLFVTGCYSELERELTKKENRITAVIPQTRKNDAGSFIRETIEKELGGEIAHVDKGWKLYKSSSQTPQTLESSQSVFYEHHRAFVKVQDGCKSFCSYCRIPYARGAPVSRSFDDILKQCRSIIQNGIAEINLSGINLGDYEENSKKLSDLVSALLELPGDTLIRISSVEPHSLDEGFFELLDHPKLAPHIHLPLQGGSDRLLEAMNRHYNTREFTEVMNKIFKKNSDFAVSTDIITGFPGESNQEFDETFKFTAGLGFMKLHVFPYSARPLTKALNLKDDVSAVIKKERAARLLKLDMQLSEAYSIRLLGKNQRLIIEKKSETGWSGTTDHYLKGLLPLDNANRKIGECVKVKLVNVKPVEFSFSGR